MTVDRGVFINNETLGKNMSNSLNDIYFQVIDDPFDWSSCMLGVPSFKKRTLDFNKEVEGGHPESQILNVNDKDFL